MILVAVLVGLLLPACGQTPVPPTPTTEEDAGPKYVAHRGYSHAYLDNTEGAFRAAASMDFYGIETDVRKTKDGAFVCNHDDSVTFADGSVKKIFRTTLAELLSQPLKNDKTTEDVRLCTFESYLRACKAGNKVAVIELKDLFLQNDVSALFEIIDAEYDRGKVCFISFIYAALLMVRAEDPSVELQYLSQTEEDPRFAECIENGLHVSVRTTILSEELVTEFHDAGLKVNVWTVDEPSDLEFAVLCGVDYVTTDVFTATP